MDDFILEQGTGAAEVWIQIQLRRLFSLDGLKYLLLILTVVRNLATDVRPFGNIT